MKWSSLGLCMFILALVGILGQGALAAQEPAAPAAPAKVQAPAPAEHGHGHEAAAHPDDHKFEAEWWMMSLFVVMLLCIAVLPLVREHWWENNWNKLKVSVALGAPVVGFLLIMGGHEGLHALLHVLEEYFSFIVLLGALYIISGGIVLRGDIEAHPMTNTIFLGIGGLLASVMGTTGAAMVLIRPILRTNSERKHVMHTVIFFIFIVSNIGGSLTPLGDPPLFMGYLRGIPFTWTLNLLPQWAATVGLLLVVYYIWDSIAYRKETKKDIIRDETQVQPLSLVGKINLLFIAGVVCSVAFINPLSLGEDLAYLQTKFYLREVVMGVLTLMSLGLTPKGLRQENKFTYNGILEVAFLFLGIFATMVPAIMWLKANGGDFGVDQPWQFFWMTGILSAFLDNTPTYIVYFELASAQGEQLAQMLPAAYQSTIDLPAVGDAAPEKMPELILLAISVGAVFMGAMTYIGNAPNFMVKVIAEESKIKMPSFFGYMAWSVLILVPIFIGVTFIWFVV